ncbi:MAG: hypothetical protein AB7P12_09400 [Alphaproteobacteria bacterium]
MDCFGRLLASFSLALATFALTTTALAANSSAFTIDPFNNREVARIDWSFFPNSKHLVNMTSAKSGAVTADKSWSILYERDFISTLGETSEQIQSRASLSGNDRRLVIHPQLNNPPSLCEAVLERLNQAHGNVMVFADTSYTSKILLDKKTKLTMDNRTVQINAQWKVGSTSINFQCLRIEVGKDNKGTQILLITLGDFLKTKKLEPILWLTCSVQSTTRFSDGEVRESQRTEMNFGVDFNHSNIIRLDNSPVDTNASITDGLISFKTRKKTGISISVNRYTGSLSGNLSQKIEHISAESSFRGNCQKLDRAKRKF